MKLLSIAVPCYNSQDYMRNCVDSLLKGGELVEILIVNDGSKDDTEKIADEYAEKYPTIVRAIHQENGGHGEAVNTGIRNATGFYFKVVDSDDWVNEEAFEAILKKLQELIAGPQTLDMMISNFVYEKQGVKRKKIMRYRKYLPQNRIFTWDEVSNMPVGKYILMHSVIYRTELLRECGLELPKHTFYVDNLFVYQPLMSVKTMYYMDENFYRYFIGREDQSVHEDVMIRRIDQQLLVNRLMVDTIAGKKISNKHLRQYMLRYLDIITTVSSVMLIRSGTEESLTKKKDLMGGQFASNETVTIVGLKLRAIENVRILGPVRSKSQVEVSATDAIKLGMKVPVRMSGDLAGSAPIAIVGPKGAIYLKEGCIVAMRHIHMSPKDAQAAGVKNGDIVSVKADNERGTIFNHVAIRVDDSFTLEMHIDTDEANAAKIATGNTVTIIK